jgi:hypothetical protein
MLPAGEPAAAVFVVHTSAGEDHTGPLRKWALEGALRLGGDHPLVVEAKDVVTVRRRAPLPAFSRRDFFLMSHGNRFPFDPKESVRLQEGLWHFHALPPLRGPRGSLVRVPRSLVSVWWLTAPRGTADAELFLGRLARETRARDLVYLRGGDTLEGTVTAFDSAGGCQVETGERKVTLRPADLAAIAFSTELQARLRLSKPYTHMVLTSGGRLDFAVLQLEPGTGAFKGKTIFGTSLEVPVSEVSALEPRLGRVVYLSDLEPKSYTFTPYLGVSWPLVKDAAVTGGPIRLKGATHDKGLGMHSQCRARFALDGNYRWFESLIGLDERSGRRGRARIHVLVDGKEQDLGWSKDLTAADSPLSLRINVHKARELTLEVRFGALGDVQAHVNWADARLIR